MLISLGLLAVSLSIDSLGIGITYGLKSTRIPIHSKMILFMISFLITLVAIKIGRILSYFLPEFICKLIGSILLCVMGIYIIYQAFHKSDTPKKCQLNTSNVKAHKFIIKSLGLTIEIIRNPNSSDFDHSNTIDSKEAIYLGLAMSMDSLCSGIGFSMLGTSSIVFPVFVASFQMIFLSLGNFFGKKLNTISKLPDQIWSIVSGVLLFYIGIFKFFL